MLAWVGPQYSRPVQNADTFFNEQLSNYVQFSVAFRQDILTDILLIPECDCNIVTFGQVNWLARNQDNVHKWSDMSIRGLWFQ
jgi:hypothetical protein